MKIRWTPGDRIDLRELQDYIAQDSPTAADLVASRIRTAVATLADTPLLGRKGREGSPEGTYELVVPRTRYIVAYRIRGEVVEILAVVHQSRRWPERFYKCETMATALADVQRSAYEE